MKLILEAIKALFRNVESSCSALSDKISALSVRLYGLQSRVVKTESTTRQMWYEVATIKEYVHSVFVKRSFVSSNSTIGNAFEIEIEPSNQVILVDQVSVKKVIANKQPTLYLNDTYIGPVCYDMVSNTNSLTEWLDTRKRYCKITKAATGWTFIENEVQGDYTNGSQCFYDVRLYEPITKIRLEYGDDVRVGVNNLVVYYSPIPN